MQNKLVMPCLSHMFIYHNDNACRAQLLTKRVMELKFLWTKLRWTYYKSLWQKKQGRKNRERDLLFAISRYFSSPSFFPREKLVASLNTGILDKFLGAKMHNWRQNNRKATQSVHLWGRKDGHTPISCALLSSINPDQTGFFLCQYKGCSMPS